MLTDITMGLKAMRPGYHFETEDYPYIHCIFVLQGKLNFVAEGTAVTATRGSALLLMPHSAFRLYCSDIGYRGIGVGAKSTLSYPAVARCMQGDSRVLQLAQTIHDELEHPQDDDTGLRTAMCWNYLGLVIRQYRQQEQGPDTSRDSRQWTEQVCRVIEASAFTPTPVEELLHRFPLCQRQLSRHFRKCMGMSMKHYQLQCKVEEAKRLLTVPTYSMGAVAMELGFPSAQHFATQFRALSGRTPSEYRREQLAAQVNA